MQQHPRPGIQPITVPHSGRSFLPAVAAVLYCLVAIFVPQTGSGAEAKDPRMSFFQAHAGSVAAAARDREDFLEAAGAYYELVEAGVLHAGVFYNIGTALLEAEEYDKAAWWLRRAELYQGSNWEIRRNLLLAINKGDRDGPVSLPWYRTPLFWHFDLAMKTRGAIATIAYFLAWLALLLNKGKRVRPLFRPLLAFSLAAFALFATSYLASVHKELVAASEQTAFSPAAESAAQPTGTAADGNSHKEGES